MNESPIYETAFPRIGRNIPKLIPEILTVANPMLMESHLPNLAMKLRSHRMGESALDALRAPLNSIVCVDDGVSRTCKCSGMTANPCNA
jgi:hypothetical protein